MRFLSLIVFLLLLAACGGGGSGSGSVTPSTPPPSSGGDTTPPVISLNGDETESIALNSVYNDPGATAQDDQDGTVSVNAMGAVDTTLPGVYTITYSATDTAGNSSTLERTVTVESQKFLLTINSFGDANFSSNVPLNCSVGEVLCTHQIEAGTTVEITASGAAGSTFFGWSNCDSITGSTCTVDMTGDRGVFATSTSNNPVVVSSDVIELNIVEIATIFEFDESTNTVSFNIFADTSQFVPGKIITSKGNANGDFIFAGRISERTVLTSGITVIQMADIAPEDIIESGSVVINSENATITILKSDIPEGVEITSKIYEDDEKIISGPTISFNLTGLVIYEEGDLRVTAVGSAQIEPEIEWAFEVCDDCFLPTLDEARIISRSKVTSNIGLSFNGDIPSALSFEYEKLFLPKTSIDVIVGGLPLVISAEAQMVFDFKTGFSVKFEPSMSFELEEVTVGLHQKRGEGLRLISDRGRDPDISFTGFNEINQTLSGSFTVDAAIGLKKSFKLYRVAGPFLKTQVFGRGKILFAPAADCEISSQVDAGLRVTAGGEADLVFKRYRYNFPETEVGLGPFEAPIACSSSNLVPAPVRGTVVESTDQPNELRVSWDPFEDDANIVAYEVLRKDPGSLYFRLVSRPTAENFDDSYLAAETEYCYFVRAVDIAGNLSPAPNGNNGVCNTTPIASSTDLPDTPAFNSIGADQAFSLALDWTSNASADEPLNFVIYDVTDPDAPFAFADTVDTSITLAGLQSGLEYCFVIVSIDSRSNSSNQSNTLCGTPTGILAGDAFWVSFENGDPGVPGDDVLVDAEFACGTCPPEWRVVERILLGDAEAFTFGFYGEYSDNFGTDDFGANILFDSTGFSCRVSYTGDRVGFGAGELVDAPTVNGVDGDGWILPRANIESGVNLLKQRQPDQCSNIDANEAYVELVSIGSRLPSLDGLSIGLGTGAFATNN